MCIDSECPIRESNNSCDYSLLRWQPAISLNTNGFDIIIGLDNNN